MTRTSSKCARHKGRLSFYDYEPKTNQRKSDVMKFKKLSRTATIAIISVLALSSVGVAALVGYLSNTITATFEVSEPLVMTISEDTFNIYGGETANFQVTLKNNANTEITGKAQTTLSNPEGITCADVDEVNLHIVSEQPEGTVEWEGDVTITSDDICSGDAYDPEDETTTNCCETVSSDKVGYRYGKVIDDYSAGRLDTINTEVTFNSAASGTYIFDAVILPV